MGLALREGILSKLFVDVSSMRWRVTLACWWGGRGFEGLVNNVAKRFACLLDLDR